MIKFLLIFLLLLPLPQNDELSEIRNLYQMAAEEESAAKKLLKMTDEGSVEQPVFFGYKGAGHMMMAKHVINPISKMSHFNKGKKIFTVAIEKAPSNLELRFLRFAVQSESPGFLGYKEHIEEDKALLLKGVANINDGQLRKMIADYLLSSEEVSTIEKAGLLEKNH
ncbi:hypothetical protein V6B16_12175 [Salinimicrobium catena]|uniref:hypothetical protein n=1 Tax=Salinimicrobium catena TaxID=390640 RepID=UPI002FE4D572